MSKQSQETRRRDSQSRYLRTRVRVRQSDPDYDVKLLAYIKSKIVIDPVRGCWMWQGYIHPDFMLKTGKLVRGGYGKISYRGRLTAVHRAVWTILKGAPPRKMDVCHECDVRHCCNPDHLWLGTRTQNLKDMVSKRRGPCGAKAAKTVCDRGHPLSGENLYTWGTHRRCKECIRIWNRQPHVKAAAAERQRLRQRALRAAKEQRA